MRWPSGDRDGAEASVTRISSGEISKRRRGAGGAAGLLESLRMPSTPAAISEAAARIIQSQGLREGSAGAV